MTGNNHSDSSSRKRGKIKPYIRWDKETDEWECRSYIEYEIEPKEYNEYSMTHTAHRDDNKEICMERRILDAISRCVLKLRTGRQLQHPSTATDLERIDNWLTIQYEMLKPEYEVALQGHLSEDYEVDCVNGD